MFLKVNSYIKVIRSISALLLVMMLIILVGCTPDKTGSSDDSSKPKPSVSDTSSNDVSNSDNVDATPSKVKLNGIYSITDSVIKPRDDADEVVFSGNCAALSNPVKGYADSAAEQLRNSIVNSDNTDKNYKITGTKYYISPDGDDSNDGKSESTPFRTTAIIGSLNLQEGDAVLFECGSVFRISGTISTKSGVIYGSYGKGAKPKICASPISLADSTLWTPTKTKNIWKVNYPYKEVGGIFFEHGETIAYKKNKVKELTKDYDFYHDSENGILYLRFSGGNPGKAFKSIEASTAISIITIPSKAKNIVIDNLCLKYSSYMGIRAILADNIRITNCEIGYIGGMTFSAKVRFGNAIEAWNGATNFHIANNWIYQTFDSAVTWQGNNGGKYENIKVLGNLFEYNNADIEYWDSGTHTLKNVAMDNNIMRFTSMGWGTRLDDGGIRGIEGSFVGTSTLAEASDVSFKNNIIDCPAREIIKWDFSADFKNAVTISANKIYVKKDLRTTDSVIKNSKLQDYKATNLDELKNAFTAIDPLAELYWYD